MAGLVRREPPGQVFPPRPRAQYPEEATPTSATPAAPTATPGAVSPTLAGTPVPAVSPTATVTGSNFKWRDDASGTMVTTIKVGGTVTWKIANPSATHSLQKVAASAASGCDELDDSFSSDDLDAGDTVTRTFTKAGTFGYNCGIHEGTSNCKTSSGSGMAGIIKVVP